MSSQADKIRSINSPGWDGVNAVQLKVNNFEEQKKLDILYHRWLLCFEHQPMIQSLWRNQGGREYNNPLQYLMDCILIQRVRWIHRRLSFSSFES